MQSHMGYHDDYRYRVATHCHAIARNNSATARKSGRRHARADGGADCAAHPARHPVAAGRRESRGISAQQAAPAIRGSESKISRIELGRNAIREIDVLDLLTYYSVGAVEREQLLSLAEQANRPGWWHRYNDILPDWFQSYVGMEEAATSIRTYEPQFIPGLLQTQQYAAAVLAVGDIPISEAERHVILRKERQRRFTEGRLTLWAIVDETVLRRPIGSKEILRDQLRYLLSLNSRQNLTLQIIPLGMGATSRRAGSASCGSASRTCPTSPTWNTSPAPFTSTRNPTSTVTCWPWSGSASSAPNPARHQRSSPRSSISWRTSP